MVLPGVLVVVGLAAAASLESKVEVMGVHLCCPGCVKGVAAALKGIDGVKPACDQENSTVTITADDDQAAQKALDALGAAGYFGDTGNPKLAIKQDLTAPQGKVDKLSLTGIHNCCRQCTKAIKDAVKKVDGVGGDTAQAKGKSFDVTGSFDAAQVIKALNAAGFHVQVTN
jgi:periplasmic mercuric ion binding protein